MNPESFPAEAAAWAARLDAGPLHRDEAEALLRWLDADSDNEGRLEEIQALQQKVRLVLPVMAAAGQLPESRRASRLRPVLAWGSALAAVLAVGVFWLVQRPLTFVTGAAQRQVVMLADGTRAELNARTTLRVRLRGKERRVTLEGGEALFTVTKDSARPFSVETTAGQVRVTGTVFNVSLYTAGSVTVVLLEGSVEATPAGSGETRHLTPGDELVVVAGHSDLRRLSATEIADVMAWREGRIVFHNTPLAQALERFANHHARVIEVAPGVQDLALGGRFGLDDFDAFLKDLAVALPVVVHRAPAGHIRVERTQTEER
jgi:transmembrane sensor